MLRVGRYGPYVQQGEERASIPEDLAPDELTVERAEELLAAGSSDRSRRRPRQSGLPVVVRPAGTAPTCSSARPPTSREKPRTASLFDDGTRRRSPSTRRSQLLSLPAAVGHRPGRPARRSWRHNGRYGPYIEAGLRLSVPRGEEQLLDVTLDEAMAIFAQPKERRGRGAAAPPLRELGADPETDPRSC